MASPTPSIPAASSHDAGPTVKGNPNAVDMFRCKAVQGSFLPKDPIGSASNLSAWDIGGKACRTIIEHTLTPSLWDPHHYGLSFERRLNWQGQGCDTDWKDARYARLLDFYPTTKGGHPRPYIIEKLHLANEVTKDPASISISRGTLVNVFQAGQNLAKLSSEDHSYASLDTVKVRAWLAPDEETTFQILSSEYPGEHITDQIDRARPRASRSTHLSIPAGSVDWSTHPIHNTGTVGEYPAWERATYTRLQYDLNGDLYVVTFDEETDLPIGHVPVSAFDQPRCPSTEVSPVMVGTCTSVVASSNSFGLQSTFDPLTGEYMGDQLICLGPATTEYSGTEF